MRKMTKLSSIILIFILILSIAIEGAAATKQQVKKAVQKEKPKLGGTLIFGLGKEFANPNPFIGTTLY